MNEIPVVSRSQRRAERRQMAVMVILIMAVTVASFFLGVMVGERGALPGFGERPEPLRLPMAQVAPPPVPSGTASAPQKLTFYDDLPKGSSAPLGSGINLPKGGYAASSPAPAPAPAPASAPAPAVDNPPSQAAVAPAAPSPPTAEPPKAMAGGSYVVQVAATRDQAEARRMVDGLKGKGFAANSERADLGAKGVWFRVVVGPYADQPTADRAAQHLKQLKYAAIVRRK